MVGTRRDPLAPNGTAAFGITRASAGDRSSAGACNAGEGRVQTFNHGRPKQSRSTQTKLIEIVIARAARAPLWSRVFQTNLPLAWRLIQNCGVCPSARPNRSGT
jgi:hypothetical protein